MNKIVLSFLFFALPAVLFCQPLRVDYLRCENKVNPLGIESKAPLLSWQLKSDERGVLQKAYRVIVADDSSLLQKNIGNIWDSKKVTSGSSINVPFAGKKLLATKTYYWKVQVWDNKNHISPWAATTAWQMGLPEKTDWKAAQWIAYDRLPDSNVIVPAAHGRGKKEWGTGKDILPYIRRDFTVTRPVKKATAFICGLGQFDMHINGKKVGDHFLDPGWTQYTKHALYVTFDITSQLKQGANAIGVMLGNGFYYIPRERYRKLTGAFGYPKMKCRILLEYADGTSEDVTSGAAWKTAPGPIIFSSIYGGEDYDAGLEQNGWDRPGFNDAGWKPVVSVDGPPVLNSQLADPLKVMETFQPKLVTKVAESTHVYDLGQNASGIPWIKVQGKRGDTVRIVPAELINDNGTANQKNTGSPSYFTYILKGGGEEIWQPQFTYYGFRYLQVEKAVTEGDLNGDSLPVVLEIKGLHTRNAAERVGQFECSSDLFNKTEKLIDWAIKSNMASVFTDCPHREKLGWLEEAHLVGSSVRYNYDIATLCKKVIGDMKAAQTAEGLVPEIAPEFVSFEEPFRDSPEWGSNCVIMPWYVYQWYGDKQILADSYNMMQRYVAYLATKANNHILTQGLGDWYDLGPKAPGVSQLTPKGVTATAMYYYDLTILYSIAKLLGKPQDAVAYNKLAADVRIAFNKTYFNDTTKQYATGSQTANAIAVYMKLVDPKEKDAVVENIIKDIRSRNNALTAGDIGYRYLLRVLDDEGHSDVIFDMNSRNDVPGYGFQLAHGATALTESWAALTSVSNNHFMLGHILEWFYSGLAGIRPGEGSVAFNKIEIRPEPVGNISWAKASYQSPYGLVKSAWKKTTAGFELEVNIPANTIARVYLPGNKQAAILQDGKKVKPSGKFSGKLYLTVGSGYYRFFVK
ncbi:MAG: family 78 glycoside hydrolase catalytic domain [Chitinophagaceae bacterium]